MATNTFRSTLHSSTALSPVTHPAPKDIPLSVNRQIEDRIRMRLQEIEATAAPNFNDILIVERMDEQMIEQKNDPRVIQLDREINQAIRMIRSNIHGESTRNIAFADGLFVVLERKLSKDGTFVRRMIELGIDPSEYERKLRKLRGDLAKAKLPLRVETNRKAGYLVISLSEL